MNDAGWMKETHSPALPGGCAPSRIEERKRALAVIPCYNSREWSRGVVSRIPAVRECDVLFVDDGSTDGTAEVLGTSGYPWLRHETNRGLGAAIKTGIRQAVREGYEAVVVLAGNGKDDPAEIPRLLDPVLGGTHDYVQGSRFLPGASHPNLPAGRFVLVKLHAFLIRRLTGFPSTDAINGFRAYRLSVLADPRIHIWQDWLDGYELETYLHYKTLTLGYRVREVPVSKSYPPRAAGGKYSHVRPVLDWWRILRPLLLLRLGLRR